VQTVINVNRLQTRRGNQAALKDETQIFLSVNGPHEQNALFKHFGANDASRSSQSIPKMNRIK